MSQDLSDTVYDTVCTEMTDLIYLQDIMWILKWCSIGLKGLKIYKEYLIAFLLKFYSVFLMDFKK